MRGKGGRCEIWSSFRGITPAYAGKRAVPDDRCTDGQDHPRLCGEKAAVFVIGVDRLGSPPPMRGKAVFQTNAFDVFGITPAYAGKSNPEMM